MDRTGLLRGIAINNDRAALGLVATGPSARRLAPVLLQATTGREPWDPSLLRHAQPDSRSIARRMDKAGYRDKHLLWSGLGSETLDARVSRKEPSRQFLNTAEGIEALVAFCQAHQVNLVVMEATGGYERQPFGQLWVNGMPTAIVNPRGTRQRL